MKLGCVFSGLLCSAWDCGSCHWGDHSYILGAHGPPGEAQLGRSGWDDGCLPKAPFHGNRGRLCHNELRCSLSSFLCLQGTPEVVLE